MPKANKLAGDLLQATTLTNPMGNVREACGATAEKKTAERD